MSLLDVELFSDGKLFDSWLGLEKSLSLYSEYWQLEEFKDADRSIKEDLEYIPHFLKLLSLSINPFNRDSFTPGHITGSALITNNTATKVLLTYHRKLNKWLQLGGHSDGSSETHLVSYREAHEESGLKEINLASLPHQSKVIDKAVVLPFDIDIHHIPQRKSEPDHEHFDLRFLVVADENQPLLMSAESMDLKWFSISDARAANQERSMQRQFDKLELLTT